MPNDKAYKENLKRLSELLIEKRQGVVSKVDQQDPADLGRQVKELNELIDAVEAATAKFSVVAPGFGMR